MTTQKNLILFFFLLLSSYTFTSLSATEAESIFGNPIDRKLLGHDKEQNISHFQFYWQDIVGGPNATSIPIVQPIPKFNTTSAFGLIRVIDNALTIGPNLTSKVIGRAQGFYVSVSETELDLLMVETFVFYEGRYNGSTIDIVGRNVAFNQEREIPIVGGSGVFRFAKGYAQLRTLNYDAVSGDTLVQYDVYVYHR
ncbi:hypothetical protein PIB30_053438 [Stylosanthes scabra]|uniref:Dirigent protein n=1 Tax=Stylosanthes scabra TaxID=79078 RepID=A0ABU6RJ05_9FABA|nr:hypothetical protein [Stylosanthes scabra]